MKYLIFSCLRVSGGGERGGLSRVSRLSICRPPQSIASSYETNIAAHWNGELIYKYFNTRPLLYRGKWIIVCYYKWKPTRRIINAFHCVYCSDYFITFSQKLIAVTYVFISKYVWFSLIIQMVKSKCEYVYGNWYVIFLNIKNGHNFEICEQNSRVNKLNWLSLRYHSNIHKVGKIMKFSLEIRRKQKLTNIRLQSW